MNNNNWRTLIKPFFKYPGGKTKELKYILPMIPRDIERIVEPFAGGCALAFHMELPALVSDINDNVTNTYQIVKDTDKFKILLDLINETNLRSDDPEKNIKHLEALYYRYRDDEFENTDPVIKAYRFLLLRQLGFSGMYRVNVKTGKSNVPFGWYREFKTRVGTEYHDLLATWEIHHQSFEETLKMTRPSDFLFLDPPYFERNSTYGTNSDAGDVEDLHRSLVRTLGTVDCPWLLIHSDCELYRDLYSSYHINEIDFRYSQNFKGRDNMKSVVKHLYITNYECKTYKNQPNLNLVTF